MLKTTVSFIILLTFLLAPMGLGPYTVQAQVSSPSEPEIDFESFNKRFAASTPQAGPGSGIAIAATDSSRELDRALQNTEILRLQLAREFLRRRLEFDKLRLQHRNKVLEWQHESTQVIFWLVVGIVTLGVSMSYKHFLYDESSVTKIAIGKAGIEISSRFIGVIVLFMSLLFFYLYLATVYPVREISHVTYDKAGDFDVKSGD